ncbi:hypothetical protein A6V36_11810 [Paraburkholderia ginsengiterrae]|uniref:DUF5666 domain-containing protein n=1 Tax=Paraburkholderia ginsengiterrae TaxID=1462993 RepID=A0A1A9N3P3_9BURK|nr:hypothetical protein [Paraburkholderia ginsengiterrae]OAJ53047.1 hypothetical protein A6V36_11810 [Paraburkholderia ginsengiterrae]OAJ55744.1 hypothetical protein A6V37_05875 [Paraburkholderia ginsengiterrae]
MLLHSSARSTASKRYAAIAVAIGFSSWLSVCAAADSAASAPAPTVQSGATVDNENGTISFIDKQNSLVVVSVNGGQQLSLNAKEHADVLDRVHVGDKIAISYQEPYVTALTRAKGTPLTRMTRTVKVTESAPAAGQDGFKAVRTNSGVVDLTAINRKQHVLTIADATGTAHTIKVSDPALVKVVGSLARHDHVQISYDSAVTVTITR